MSVFFTSDLHFGHANIILHCNRPWQTAEEMTEGLIERWNKTVKPMDEVWMLGDIFFCKLTAALQIMDRLNGIKKLIHGNHDQVIRKNPSLQEKFETIYPDLYTRKLDGVLLVSSHYPLMSWEKQRYGSYMLHGHTHSEVPVSSNVRRYDVGVDAHDWYPVSWEQIHSTLSAIAAVDSRDEERVQYHPPSKSDHVELPQ